MARKRAIKGTKIGQSTLPIALVFGYDRRGCASILRGISRYARGCDKWTLVSVFPRDRLSGALNALKPAGIIVGEECPGIAGILRKAGQPVVSTCLTVIAPHLPRVTLDETSVGAMAAKHLIECGLRNFGYFGPPWGGLTAEREGGFHQALQRLSHKAAVCYVRPSKLDSRRVFASHKHVCRWLTELPKPAGIFAPTDTWALWLCGVCKQEGIKVPEEIAVVGADNDELVCDLSQPTLSSVVFPFERIGYEAAAMLARLINRKPVPEEPVFLPATSVVTRQSTNILAGVESVVSTAVHFIREHFLEPIVVEDLMQHVRMHRRSFERKFREAIGRSPAQEIRRMRIAMAKTLLAGKTRMKTEGIAKRSGFASVAQFFKAFHQATGMTPADYRRTVGQESNR